MTTVGDFCMMIDDDCADKALDLMIRAGMELGIDVNIDPRGYVELVKDGKTLDVHPLRPDLHNVIEEALLQWSSVRCGFIQMEET